MKVNGYFLGMRPIPAHSQGMGPFYIFLFGGGNAIAIIDPVNLSILSTIPVGSNPNDLVLTQDGKYLFTSCANDNSVHVIDTESEKVIEKLQTACFPDAPAGSTPNVLALSGDNKKLYGGQC